MNFLLLNDFVLNSSSNSLLEILSIKDVLVDFLIYQCISFMAIKMLKFLLSGLILINTQRSSFSIAFYLCIS